MNKKKSILTSQYIAPVKKVLRKYHLNSVCESALCPNIAECFRKRTATFLILGNICTRSCTFCNINKNKTAVQIDPNEPEQIKNAAEELDLKYIVITSVTRDDLEDGGASHFRNVATALRTIKTAPKIELLTPDFKGKIQSLKIISKASPDIFNHNIETVQRLYTDVRPEADYQRSLSVIEFMKNENMVTKSGLMVGLGEKDNEVKSTIKDLKNHGCDILTIGQYFMPSKKHFPLQQEMNDHKFEQYKEFALSYGFKEVYSGRYVRSSFNAEQLYRSLKREIND